MSLIVKLLSKKKNTRAGLALLLLGVFLLTLFPLPFWDVLASEEITRTTSTGAEWADAWAVEGVVADENDLQLENADLTIDPTVWTIGTGSAPGFTQNGTDEENHRISANDPFGDTAVIWEARPDSDSNADGGWNTTTFDIDPTKAYRFSVWVNRMVQGSSGRFYLGANGYDNGGSNVGLLNRSTGANSTNPYFWYSSTPPNDELPTGEWILVVGHIWPAGSGTGTNHPDSGRYRTSGVKLGNIHYDHVWQTDNAQARHRSYLYYSTDTSTRQRWAYPRVDIVDGSEPSVQDLLDGWPDLKKESGYRISQPLSLDQATNVEDSLIEWSTGAPLSTVNLFDSVSHRWWQRADTTTSYEAIANYNVRTYGTQTIETSNGTYYYPVFSVDGDQYYTYDFKIKINHRASTSSGSYTGIGLREGNNGDDIDDSYQAINFQDMEVGQEYRLIGSGYLPSDDNQITVRGTIAYDLAVGEEIDIEWYDMKLYPGRADVKVYTAVTDESKKHSLDFNGINDYIALPTEHFQPNRIFNNISGSAWIYWKGGVTSGIWGMSGDEIGEGGQVHWEIRSDDFRLRLGDVQFTTPTKPPINEWAHVAFSYNDTSKITKLYLNGEEIYSHDGDTGEISTYRTYNHIGDSSGIATRPFDGMIDDFCIYNRAFTQSEIQETMYQELIGSETGLVAYYKMNEGAGTTVYDKTTNNNNGTIYGATWSNDSGRFQEATSGNPIPGINEDDDLTGKYLWVKQALSTNDASITPTISSITETIIYGGTSVETQEATGIGPYSATLAGAITELEEGGSALERGFEWSKTEGGPYNDSWTEEGTFTVGSFSHQISDLDDNTVYYFRAKARDVEGWVYGEEISFQTLEDNLQVSTVGSQVKTGERVYLTGSIDQVSTLENPTQRGFEWSGTAGGPYLYSWTEEGDFMADEFYYSLEGLIHNTTYYFRAKAYDLEGWAYGEEAMFTTYYDPHPEEEEEIAFSIEEHDEGWPGTENNVSVSSEGLVLSSGVSGTRTSTSYDLSSIGTSGGSEISWSGNIPSFGGALDFDGLDDYVVVDTPPSIPSGSNQATVSYWMKADSFSDDWQYAFHLHRDEAGTDIGNSVIWGGLSSSNNIVLTIGGVDGHYSDGDTGITPVLGDWYHIAAVWDGGYVKVYVNGNQEVMYPRTSLTAANSPIHIGAHQSGGGYRQFDATIDEVRVWSIARTQQQIQNDMYQELFGSESGLVGYWKLNEAGGSVVYDSSASSNNGTIAGATWSDGIQSSVGVETNVSLNGGSDWQGWQSVNNGDAVPGLEHGTDISNGRLQVRQTLATNNASVSPLVEESTINIFLYYSLYDEHGANVGGWAWSENIGWISFNNDDVADYLASYNSSSGEIEGWAWSENIGWISWNCATDSACNPITEDYKVSVSDGNLSGWAWSDNLGWLSFDRNVTGDPPGEPYQSDGAIARYDSSLKKFSGWARFTVAPEGGWDGWIKFRCYGDECDDWKDENGATGGLFVREDNYLDGWIWGSDVVGWISAMGVGAHNYGLNINTENFKLRGHIWSDNLGWITFNRDGPLGAGTPPENDPCPLEDDCIAIFDPDESTFHGWARAVRHGDGWDGWISLSGTALDESTYGISLNPTTNRFEGWAYGGELLGWISFNSINEVSNPPEYYVYTTMELGLDASGLASEWNYCVDTLHPTLSWETEETIYGYSIEIYSDVDLNNLVYQYEVSDSGAVSHHADYDAGNCHLESNGYQNTGTCNLEYGGQDYWWRVKVKNAEGLWGSWSTTAQFTVENDHHWPEPGFSFSPDPTQVEEETNFIDESTAYGGSSLSAWLWILSGSEGIDYNYVNETTSASQNPDVIFVNADDYSAALDVWDSSGYGPCRLTQMISVDEASDIEWREVSPTN